MLPVKWSKCNSTRLCVVCAKTNIDKRLLWLALAIPATKSKRQSLHPRVLARPLMFPMFLLVLLSSAILLVECSLPLVHCSMLVKTSYLLRV